MARKKIVLFIVEGPSDDTALGVILNQIYDKDAVHIEIMYGDITTRKGVVSQNIVSKLGEVVKGFAKSRHYKYSDFKQIVHLVDTDGAYIPDDNIFEDSSLEQYLYEDDGIHAASKESAIIRNVVKRDNLLRLIRTGKIWKVPYRVYYMSCNLDHVLHGKRNSTEEEKENDAYAFAKKYRRDRDGFVDFICNSDFSINNGFKESWDCIQQELNSINRHTNFCICIAEEMKAQEKSEKEEKTQYIDEMSD